MFLFRKRAAAGKAAAKRPAEADRERSPEKGRRNNFILQNEKQKEVPSCKTKNKMIK
jgi:hypothetical protein